MIPLQGMDGECNMIPLKGMGGDSSTWYLYRVWVGRVTHDTSTGYGWEG